MSCQKEDQTPTELTQQEASVQTPEENVPSDNVHSLDKSYTISGTILSATNASQIPSTFLKIDPKYKSAYIHMGQPDGTSCSWTSYMLAVGAIARGNGKAYECSAAKVYRIKAACGNTSWITNLASFANSADKQYVLASYSSEANTSTGRFNAIKKMLYFE